MASLLDRLRGHELLPQYLRDKLPPLYANEALGLQAIAPVKFFTPRSDWTWYATEFDPTEEIFFGLVYGFEREFGNFSLEELESTTDRLKLPAIERDLGYTPKTLAQVMELHTKERGEDFTNSQGP